MFQNRLGEGDRHILVRVQTKMSQSPTVLKLVLEGSGGSAAGAALTHPTRLFSKRGRFWLALFTTY